MALVAFAFLAGAYGWFVAQNVRTLRQRAAIIDAVFALYSSNDHSVVSDFRRVPYEKHLWALLCRRDPLNLYPISIQRLMKS